MRIPKRHQEASWDASCGPLGTLRDLPYTNTLLKFVEMFPKVRASGSNVLIHGPYGSGKSACAAMMLRDVAFQHKVFGYWLNAMTVQDVVINRVQHDEDRSSWDWALAAPLLVLDDLVLSDQGKFRDQQLEILVRSRLDSLLPTIVTCNFDVDRTRELYPALAGAMDGTYTQIGADVWNFRKMKPCFS